MAIVVPKLWHYRGGGGCKPNWGCHFPENPENMEKSGNFGGLNKAGNFLKIKEAVVNPVEVAIFRKIWKTRRSRAIFC